MIDITASPWRLSQNPRSHALRGNAYRSQPHAGNLYSPEPAGVSSGLFVCAEYGMHSHGGPWKWAVGGGGWDTHDNQLPRLSRQFQELDSGLKTMRASMGETTWSNTIVMIATEFGRTVAMNGTGGTDHGTASCLFMAGGAVKGGKVEGYWPGLAEKDLYEGRDLRPTSDIRQWISVALMQHWQLSAPQLKNIFPDITPARIV